ncbi:MAG: homocysteine S-methyltransferase family protein [Eggerthellaceae bacterium]|nr:homocysteine S-methyltransferase family protein [Eggerthellaceae bacterium]
MTKTMRVKDEYLRRVLAGEAKLLFDGAMGTMLQHQGLQGGELPELLCLTNPDEVTAIHRAYVEAGSQVVTTNTFGANRLRLGGEASVDDVFAAAVKCARDAGATYVAADLGPTGELLDPLGDLEFEEAYELYAEQVRAAMSAGADLFIVETMADPQEAQAAVTAAKDHGDVPVFATMTFGEVGRTLFGTTPEDAAKLLAEWGADAVGINCSVGPKALVPLIAQMRGACDLPLIAQPNAGLPQVVDGQTVYTITPADYAASVGKIMAEGATIVGGCCGTDPDFIRELAKVVR